MGHNDILETFLVDLLKDENAHISPEIASKFEWFIKKVAVEAVNESNKEQFMEILNSNNYYGLTSFIQDNVPDFQTKFKQFLEKQDAN